MINTYRLIKSTKLFQVRWRGQLSDHPVHPDLNGRAPGLPVLDPRPHRGELVAQVDAEDLVHARPASEEQKRGHLLDLLPHGRRCDHGCGEFETQSMTKLKQLNSSGWTCPCHGSPWPIIEVRLPSTWFLYGGYLVAHFWLHYSR